MKKLKWIVVILFCSSFILNLNAADPGIIISAYQGQCNDGNFDENLKTVYRVIKMALDRKSDFLCFPETFLSGYYTKEQVLRGAVKLDDPRLTKLIKSTANYDMVVLVGVAEKTEETMYNTQLVMYKGELLGKYSKIMLIGGDRRIGFETGKSMPVFEAKGVKFSCIICADSSYPEPALLARYQGAILLFSPHYNSLAIDRMDNHRIRVRNNHIGIAALTRMIVVRSNVINVHPDRLGYGDSAIFDLNGVPLAEAPLFKETLITAEIDKETIETCKKWKYLERFPQVLREKLANLLLFDLP